MTRMNKLCGWILLGLLMSLQAGAQSEDTNAPLGINEYLRSGSSSGLGLSSFGLLDPSRMSFSHSYTMSYVSSGNQGLMQGLFMETIGYRLSNPVSLTLNLGYLHQPYSSYGPDGVFEGGAFVGGAALTWRPAHNMFLRFEVANYPTYGAYNYQPYWNPFPYNLPSPIQDYQTDQGLNPSGE